MQTNYNSRKPLQTAIRYRILREKGEKFSNEISAYRCNRIVSFSPPSLFLHPRMPPIKKIQYQYSRGEKKKKKEKKKNEMREEKRREKFYTREMSEERGKKENSS